MTRKEVRSMIEDAVNDLAEAVGFGAGRISEFNKERSNTYPFAWLEELKDAPDLTPQNLPISNWSCTLRVAKKDAQDSSPAQYEDIIDDCDEIAKKIALKINQVVTGYKLVTLSGQNFDPFIKKQADILSGIDYSFTLTIPDLTNRC